MGHGRNSEQRHGQRPYGGQQPIPPHAQQWAYGGGQGGHGGQGGAHGEPEYFGPDHGYDPYAGHHGPDHGPGHDPYANNPGHTQAFSIGEAPDAYGNGGDHANTYHAGQAAAPPAGPRLHWKELLSGIVLRPGATFWQMRDYPVWGPALTVTFLYGLVAVFGLEKAREDVLGATLSNSIPWVISTGIAVVICGLLLGAVTHTLARQLGGNGSWQPTVGLSMLIMSITDAPRLVFAMFLSGDSPLVKVLGWATWVGAGALFSSMVSRSHDLAWPKALAASSIQLIALLALIKLGTL